MGARDGRTKRDKAGRRRARTAASDVWRLPPTDHLDPAPRAEALALAGVRALASGLVEGLDEVVTALVVLAHSAEGRTAVEQTLVARVRVVVRERWAAGWQPTDLVHMAQRSSLHVAPETGTVRQVGALLGDAMTDDLATYPAGSVEPAWSGQLETAEAEAWWPADQTWVGARCAQWGDAVALEAALRLEHVLRQLPPLQQLGARPGERVAAPADADRSTQASGSSASDPGRARPDVDAKILERVRRLLAKAESTTFEAEAETFTAGAQALMARHSIDHALLAATAQGRGDAGPGGERPEGRRLWVETPYAREKVLLLGSVADANRTRTVWAKEDGYITLLGFAHDLDAVETLYTSLLVQATRAMHAEGKRHDAWGGSRTRSFRASFLAAYAVRIGERLHEVTAAQTAEAAEEARAAGGRELVPVLAERAAAVEAWTSELFPELRTVTMSVGRDREGYDRGRRAADQAALSWGRPLGR